jgi:protein-tyrosine phosphatase
VPDFVETMTAAGIEVIRHPMPDQGVPFDDDAFRAVLADLRRRLDAGETVVMSCRGGLGRTGLTVACLLREAGVGADEAIALTRAARPKTIETAGQERYIRDWKRSADAVDPDDATESSRA